MCSPLHGAEPSASVWALTEAYKHTMISRVPFPNCRRAMIGRAIAGNPENDGHLSPWQEAVGQSKGRSSGRSATTAPAASIRRSSLKASIVAPSVMLRKLAAYRRQNQLDLALQELGRIERTLFMLDWLESPELRRRCHTGLNKSEQRHFLAQVICTFKQGRQTRPDCRPHCRAAAVSCLRPQPRHRRDRVLELHLHRRRHRPSPCD